ncbi:hypothetical protein CsSME_00002509 [Camellia sinensis var. sinensis]
MHQQLYPNVISLNILPTGKNERLVLANYNLKATMDPWICPQHSTKCTPPVLAGYLGRCCLVQMPPIVSPPCSMTEVRSLQNQAGTHPERSERSVFTNHERNGKTRRYGYE